jgi:hypothetical protein
MCKETQATEGVCCLATKCICGIADAEDSAGPNADRCGNFLDVGNFESSSIVPTVFGFSQIQELQSLTVAPASAPPSEAPSRSTSPTPAPSPPTTPTPTTAPSSAPSAAPSSAPSAAPFSAPSGAPTSPPSESPSSAPSAFSESVPYDTCGVTTSQIRDAVPCFEAGHCADYEPAFGEACCLATKCICGSPEDDGGRCAKFTLGFTPYTGGGGSTPAQFTVATNDYDWQSAQP